MLEISKREQHLSHAGSSWLAQTRAWHGAPPRGCPSACEARFGRISDCRRCWCRRPVRPLVHKMISRQYT